MIEFRVFMQNLRAGKYGTPPTGHVQKIMRAINWFGMDRGLAVKVMGQPVQPNALRMTHQDPLKYNNLRPERAAEEYEYVMSSPFIEYVGSIVGNISHCKKRTVNFINVPYVLFTVKIPGDPDECDEFADFIRYEIQRVRTYRDHPGDVAVRRIVQSTKEADKLIARLEALYDKVTHACNRPGAFQQRLRQKRLIRELREEGVEVRAKRKRS